MNSTLTSVPGFKVGHYTDSVNMTGCTVVLCLPKTCASCEVRGNSPGSRETALLAPEKSMQEVHAILLTGGSAFGLAAADGVMQWLSDHEIGYETPWVRVPIVPAAVVFDLNVGNSRVRPGPREGQKACEAAGDMPVQEGNVGAGTGATVGKWAGKDTWMKGGIGSAAQQVGSLIVGALVVVNAVGDILDEKGAILAGARNQAKSFLAGADPVRTFARGKVLDASNTTLAVVATNAGLTKLQLFRISQRMHDGFARAIAPVHTSYDGDVSFALSHGTVKADPDVVAELAAELVSQSVRRAVRAAKTIPGVPALS
ncbi:MAG TPA: P1 family peptidase [Bacteroidota bacterium]|nr:P1 family peptidase [Bacteroidota bacterium]